MHIHANEWIEWIIKKWQFQILQYANIFIPDDNLSKNSLNDFEESKELTTVLPHTHTHKDCIKINCSIEQLRRYNIRFHLHIAFLFFLWWKKAEKFQFTPTIKFRYAQYSKFERTRAFNSNMRKSERDKLTTKVNVNARRRRRRRRRFTFTCSFLRAPMYCIHIRTFLRCSRS